jgi:hypothetical protein
MGQMRSLGFGQVGSGQIGLGRIGLGQMESKEIWSFRAFQVVTDWVNSDKVRSFQIWASDIELLVLVSENFSCDVHIITRFTMPCYIVTWCYLVLSFSDVIMTLSSDVT